MLRNLRLIVEYDGTSLCGWQRQANGPTVQGHIEATLAQLLGGPVTVAGASRTDAGVHARGQVAHFLTSHTIPAAAVRKGLNALLPPSIAIVHADEAPLDWHPRFSATGKHYRYLLMLRDNRCPTWHGRAWFRSSERRAACDVARMQAGAAYFVGTHNFAAFRAVGCVAKTTQRHMSRVELSDLSDITPGLWAIDVHGNAFLRNMVRIMVGTLVDIGEGRMAPDAVREALQTGHRLHAGQTAPAYGLTLMRVRYDGVRGEALRHSVKPAD